MFVKHIQAETGARVQIKGRGSGFIENETGREADDEMHISIVAPTEDQIQRAKNLADDLLMVLRIEYDKARNGGRGGGGDYGGGAAYPPMAQGSGPQDPYAGSYAQPPGDSAGAPAGSAEEQWQQYLQYYASMGYDVNDPQCEFSDTDHTDMQSSSGCASSRRSRLAERLRPSCSIDVMIVPTA